MKSIMHKCRTYSVPLILGVAVALVMANALPNTYHKIIHTSLIGEEINLHWMVNDVFMTFFFAIAAVEIVNSMAKDGPLNPPKKAVTPLMATIGGVAGPIAVFFILNAIIGGAEFTGGWGICTATDIALSWLVAKVIFGPDHPAIKFLLLLAVVDDAIGLVIIAVFYPSPDKAFMPLWLALIPVGMLIAYIFRRCKVQHFHPYIIVCGTISWFGMHLAGLHAALAMVFIIPFLPIRTALHSFEKKVAPFVEFGLFFFGFTAAGVEFSNISELSLIIMLSLVLGKALGIFSMTFLATKLKFSLPTGMKLSDAGLVAIIGGIGLTVALFVSESAYADPGLVAAAKMGALGSVVAAIIALAVARIRNKWYYRKDDICIENDCEEKIREIV